MNVVGFGREFARSLKTLAGFVPAAQIHHGDAALIMVFRAPGILIGGGFHTLFGNAKMGAGTVGKFFAGTGNDALQLLFGTLKFLLMEEAHGFFVKFHLGLDQGVHHFDATPLVRRSR